MAYTATDLENVERAIIALASGQRKTRFVIDGDVVEYSAVELPALRALRNEIATEINAADSAANPTTAFRISGSKGL